MTVKRKNAAFSILELLTVLAIIAILTGILIPSVNMVRTMAKETRQKVQLVSIDMALLTFKNDHGEFPPSNWIPFSVDYCGAQKLAEALLGWDLLGFHPNTHWQGDGRSEDNNINFYDPATTLNVRKNRYLELEKANAFRLLATGGEQGLFTNIPPQLSALSARYVLCDSFGWKKITIGNQTVKAGMPILYYRANTPSKLMSTAGNLANNIYDFYDNLPIMVLDEIEPLHGRKHPLSETSNFYGYGANIYGLIDPKVKATSGVNWPYRPDSYILISAGADGRYGTSDDITNFRN